MGESFKAVCSFFVLAAVVTTAMAWIDDRPDLTSWLLRIGTPIFGLTIIWFLVKLQNRKDRATDFLYQQCGNYFNRDGFCFAMSTEVNEGVCYVVAFYQNQRDASLTGQIGLRPAKGFFLNRAKIDLITFEVDCLPGEYGMVRVPVPLPEKLQGKSQNFEVGASVKYTSGKGSRLRYRDGIFLRSNSNFGSSLSTALVVAGAASGAIVLTSPATTELYLPADVSTELHENIQPVKQTLWVYDESETT